MPTILDTLGIATATISYGKEASFAGKPATVSIRVTPMAVGVGQLRLTWAATGDIFSSFDDSTKGDPGMPGVIVLPQTGQNGFRHGTSVFKDWYYQAAVTSVLDDGQSLTRSYRFQIPAGTTSMDLDMLDEDGPVALPAVAPFIAEPAGLSTDTRASFAAAFLQLRSTEPSAAERAAGVVAYIDKSVVPPVLKGWDGTAWIALGGTPAPVVDGALLTETGDYFTTESGDLLLAA